MIRAYTEIDYKQIMMNQLKHGVLIAIEGIDGSGKSTLARTLRNSLTKEKLSVILTYEPGDTKIGKGIRKILQEKTVPICNITEFLLFAADRAQHFNDIVIPGLTNKSIVISDRMADSSVVYQGYARGLDIETINTINRWAMQNVTPDITFYVKISLKEALTRLKKRKELPTSFEKEKNSFKKKLIKGFDSIFKDRPDAIILDGTQSAEMLHKKAYAHIKRFLKEKGIFV